MNRALREYLCLILLFALSGCSLLPSRLPIGQEEKDDALRQFKKMIVDQGRCSCCLDADVSISLRNVVNAGSISGFLQGKEPSYLRFEGVNPLGMTEILAGTDGVDFRLINVRQKKMYIGESDAQKIQKYAGGRFPLQTSYYWLIGRIPPGPLDISGVSRDPEGNGYWVDIVYEKWHARSTVLFSGPEGVVLQNIILGEEGDVLAGFIYEYAAGAADGGESPQGDGYICRYPKNITIKNARGAIGIHFKQTYSDVEFDKNEFDIPLPKGFEKEVIK